MTDPTDPYGDKKKKRRGGQGNKGRKPAQTGAPKGNRVKSDNSTTTAAKAKGPGWQKDGGLLGKGGNVATGKALGAAAKGFSMIASLSGSKYHGPTGNSGGPVAANEKPPEGMDLSVGDFDTGAMGDEDQEYQKKKKMYGL